MRNILILLIVLGVVSYIKSESGDNENIVSDVKIKGADNDMFIPHTKEEMKEELKMEEKAQENDKEKLFAEGDIKVDKRFLEFRKAAAMRRDVIKQSLRWPSGEVQYRYANRPTAVVLNQVVKNAIADFTRFTCLKFIEAKPGMRLRRDYIEFRMDDDGCYSNVGKTGGKQKINLEAPGCLQKGTVIHEMMHALGFFHEHVRLDRDRFVRINLQNVEKSKKSNFEKYAVGKAGYEGEDYDYDSIMHYPIWAFSRNKKFTITPRNVPRNFNPLRLGQRLGFSATDLKQINKAYKCPAKKPAKKSATKKFI